ncbi:methylaspartate ammonia-lyase [Terrabacter terrigena]|uniref:methylaspartate ammonia-lyase n=1 Tax=Terrabacter terrigena TaxID=574718 RepID=A0ABW3MZ75_9MICO
MLIVDLVCVPVRSGFFTDDQAAIRADAGQDGFSYLAAPLTPGFSRVRMPGEALSVLLVLSDGQIAHGDCATVQYAGAGGRDPALDADAMADVVIGQVRPRLLGRRVTDFRSLATEIDQMTLDGRPLHSAARYGVTQAILDAAAKARGITMAELVRDEYGTGAQLSPVPVFAQCGDDRYTNVDKMILKGVDALPHGLVNNVETKFGHSGELFADYVEWVRARVLKLRPSESYHPVLHFDLYGTVGLAFDAETTTMAAYLARVGDLAAPFQLRIEHPVDAGSRDGQVEAFTALRAELRRLGSSVQLAADEWCNTLDDIKVFAAAGAADMIHVKTPDLGGVNNTVEALLLVRDHGLLAYCGGTCNETDRSAQVCAHIAMACDAQQVLARPGMGVDEGLMIVGNEMARTAALVAARATSNGRPA